VAARGQLTRSGIFETFDDSLRNIRILYNKIEVAVTYCFTRTIASNDEGQRGAESYGSSVLIVERANSMRGYSSVKI
jgi:hypothetical protein